MSLAGVLEHIGVVDGFDPSVASLGSTIAALESVRNVRAWLDARALVMAQHLQRISVFPERDLGTASRTRQAVATKTLKRAATTAAVPALSTALVVGSISIEHVDVMTRALAQLEPAGKTTLIAGATSLIDAANGTTPEQFEKAVSREVDAIGADDGTQRLERQRRAARLRTWIDRDTGMWRIAGEFDPETGLQLHALLEAAQAARYGQPVAPDCPTDPSAKQDWLRAQALIDLLTGVTTGTSGRPETVVVVNGTTGVVKWDLDIKLPASAVQRFVNRSDVVFIDIRDRTVVSAPGTLNLGRTTRLANRAQRRVLRALHPTCIIPGCDVPFASTKIHHIVWWRNGGLTNLNNLAPVCNGHHVCIHEKGWTINIGPNRDITVTLPDGTKTITDAPEKAAA